MEQTRAERIKETVKQAYSELWSKEAQCCQPQEADIFQASRQCCETSRQDAASPDAVHRRLMKELAPGVGMKVLDVGSGSGETVLLIGEKVAPTGKAVGVDFSEKAITLAEEKAKNAGLDDVVEFRIGDAENLPFDDGVFDAVVSECVVCLVPNKQRAFNEKLRVLKPGGKVIMHDVTSNIEMPNVIRNDPTLYCSCISGAVTIDDYMGMMKRAGLEDIKVIDYTREVQAGLNALILSAAPRIKDDKQFLQVVDFVRKGGIGYALFIGRKPKLAREYTLGTALPQ